MSTQLDDAVSPHVGSSPRAARGPQLSIKRFGRTDFERFDQEAARGSKLCVGSQRIGKVEIDCKYHWKKAQWGVLGDDGQAAGIVYMDIDFKQPYGYCLEVASVFVTLAEHQNSYALGPKHRFRRRAPGPMYADYTVQITEYGPQLINGPKTWHQKTGTTKLTPSIGAMGVEIGGVGYDSTTDKEEIDAWCFRGSIGQPKNEGGLRTIHWELKENSLDRKQIHSQEYSTAFAFVHCDRPVFMRVEINGTIRGIRGSARNKYERFSSILGGKDNSTLTWMNFSHARRSNKRLDDLAKHLNMDMQRENWKRAGVEMPESKPVHFFDPDQMDTVEDEEPSFTEALIEEAVGAEDPILEALARQIQSGRETRPSIVDTTQRPRRLRAPRQSADALEPVVRRGARKGATISAASSRPSPETRKEVRGTRRAESEASSITAVNSGPTPVVLHNDKLKDVVRIPAILFLIRFLVVVANFFSGEERQAGKSDLDDSQAPSVRITTEQEDVIQEDSEQDVFETDEEHQSKPWWEEYDDDQTESEDTVEALARVAVPKGSSRQAASSSSKMQPLPSRRAVRQAAPVLKTGG